MISYEPLWKTMKEKGITKYRLNKYHNFSESKLQRMSKGMAISLATVDDLCKILSCRVEDVLLFVDDSEK